jgi:hypothetical protein
MIVLFLVGLGSAVVPEAPTRTPKPKPPKKEPARIVGMRTTPSVRHVRYNPSALLGGGRRAKVARRSVCRRVRRATKTLSKRRAALVLIFAGGQDIGAAIASATAVSRQIGCARRVLFKRTVSRPFWDGRLSSGSARIEIFLFTTS